MHMKRVAVYIRVSTEDQAKEGYSLDAQQRRLGEYCEFNGWEIAGIYRDEGYSGRNIHRPQYRRMFEDMALWDGILVLKMDRIHRNSRNFAAMMDDLRKNGKEFISLTEKFNTTNAMGRFVMDIVQRMAQLESEQIGDRVRIGMARKAEIGDGNMGSPDPYGYTHSGGRLVIREDEAAHVREIFRLRAEGGTFGDIADHLNETNVPSKKGGRWSRQAVHHIIRNPVYAGKVRWGGNISSGSHDPIVTEEEFEAVNRGASA